LTIRMLSILCFTPFRTATITAARTTNSDIPLWRDLASVESSNLRAPHSGKPVRQPKGLYSARPFRLRCRARPPGS
jgi:hypothetical protein